MFTADNALGQANPTDVRSGVSYASGSLTGRLTVPARGSVALSVNYGPSMPFAATRSGTTATATLTYSYPLVVGDQITVTGASNSEWNSTYTIASIVSGTSVTFEVPASHSATAGTGANMQTTGTAILDPAAVASAVWGAATRTITGGTVDTLTNAPSSVTASDIWSYATRTTTGGTVDTLTNAPSVPSASAIAAAVWAAADKTGYSLTSAERSAIAAAVESSILNEADGQAVLNALVGAIGNQNIDQVALVAAIRADLERAGGKLINLDTTISSRLAASSYQAAPTPPTAAENATAVRAELTELSRLDVAVSSRLAGSEATKLDSVKAKTDALNTDRLAQVATTQIVGSLLAQANS